MIKVVDPKNPSDYLVVALSVAQAEAAGYTVIGAVTAPAAMAAPSAAAPLPVHNLIKAADPKKPGDYVMVSPADFEAGRYERYVAPKPVEAPKVEPPKKVDPPKLDVKKADVKKAPESKE